MTWPTPADLEHLLAQREWLQRLAQRLLGDGPDADDLTQETLVRALGAPAQGWRSRGWLATVARNLSREGRRAQAHRRARERESARPEACDENEALERAALRRRLLDRVLGLAEPERGAVVLRYLEGQTYAQVAARQGISVPAAHKRVSRALERLRARLDEDEGGRETWTALLAPFARPAPETTAAHPTSIAKVLALGPAMKLLGLGVALLALVLIAIGRFDLPGLVPAPLAARAGEGLEAPAPVQHPAMGQRRELGVDEPRGAPERASGAQPAFATRPAAEVGALELRLRWSDGAPAEGVRARILPWGAEDGFLHQRTARTDRQGVALVEQLAPGQAAVVLDRFGGAQVAITAGGRSLHEVVIPAGLSLRGRVLDDGGEAVSGATVWLSDRGNRNQGLPVATSDARGRFEVRDVHDERHLSARAAGFWPSDQVHVHGPAGAVLELDLVLRGKGGALAGVVLDPDGVPLSGARVLVTDRGPSGWEAADDGRRHSNEPLPFELRTDEAGRFSTDRVGAGWIRVQARAEGRVPWKGEVHLLPGAASELEIQLAPGATLVGAVLHADYTPAQGATVASGRYGDFDAFLSLSDDQGHYRIRGLPAGARQLTAFEKGRGKRETELELTTERVNDWHARLLEGFTLRGVVLDERGQPLSGWRVSAGSTHGPSTAPVKADAFGRFELTDVPVQATDVTVLPFDWPRTGPCLELHDVLPTGGELRVEVPDAVRPTASARLRVWVDGEPAAWGTPVRLRAVPGFASREHSLDPRGCLELTRLYPGAYELEVRVPDRAVQRASFRVAAGEALDLGDFSGPVGGRVRLVLEGEGSDGPVAVQRIDSTGKSVESFYVHRGEGESGLLLPGVARLRLGGGRLAFETIEVCVADGETVEQRVRLAPAALRHVLGRSADGSALDPNTSVQVYAANGELVMRIDHWIGFRKGASETRIPLGGLGLGSYRIVLESPDGRRGAGALSVTSFEELDGDAAVIEVE